MDWKVITINTFYVHLLKVGSCTNNDKSVLNTFLSFSTSVQMVLFSKSVIFWENHQILMKIVFLSMPKQCTGIPVLKITLSHAHKCMISDAIRHKSIFSLDMSFPGGSCMSDSGKNPPRTQCSMTSAVLKFFGRNQK